MSFISRGAMKQTLNSVVKYSTGCPSNRKTIMPTPRAKVSNLNVLAYRIFIVIIQVGRPDCPPGATRPPRGQEASRPPRHPRQHPRTRPWIPCCCPVVRKTDQVDKIAMKLPPCAGGLPRSPTRASLPTMLARGRLLSLSPLEMFPDLSLDLRPLASGGISHRYPLPSLTTTNSKLNHHQNYNPTPSPHLVDHHHR